MTTVIHGFVDRLVCKFIQLLHFIATDILSLGLPKDVHQPCLCHLSPHKLGCKREAVQQPRECSCCFRMCLFALNDVAFQCHEFCDSCCAGLLHLCSLC